MKVKIANQQNEFFGLMLLRKEVFVNEQNVDINIELDELDITATHFVAIDQEKVVGTCRIVIKDDYCKLGRMAVSKEYRSKGVGRKLIQNAEKTVKEMGIKKIALSSQSHALEFYLKNDYKIISEVFYEANIAHQTVEKLL